MSWVFKVADPMGDATGDAYTSVLNASGMSKEEKLAREAIQNSVDAARDDLFGVPKVAVEFRHHRLRADDRQAFIESLELSGIAGDRIDLLGLGNENVLRQLNDSQRPLDILYVDDFGTVGLDGDPLSNKSNFNRLLLTIGLGDKARTDKSTGGSYGFGKSVYPSSSRIHTIVAFSRTHDGQSRLMGCGFHSDHELEGTSYTGRSWFGVQDDQNPNIVHPFTGPVAMDIADKLGFGARNDDSRSGTSILIVDCPISVDEIRQSVEMWWWPRIHANLLDVRLFEDGVSVDPPRPKSRPRLRPFIECMNLITNAPEDVPSHQEVRSFRKHHGVDVGSIGLTMLTSEDEEESGDDTLNSVALIRMPHMVVDYFGAYKHLAPYKGVFLADASIDKTLKLSEPANHDRWDINSDRLREIPNGTSLIESIHRRIRETVKNFVDDTAPPEEQGQARLTALEKLLGAAFRPPDKTGSGGPDDNIHQPISIQFQDGPRVVTVGSNLQIVGTALIRLMEKADVDEMDAKLHLNLSPIADGDSKSGERLGAFVVVGSEEVASAADGQIAITLQKDQDLHVVFESASYSADWSVEVQLKVTGEEN